LAHDGSQELDSYLVLQDTTGKELGFDDDGSGTHDSWLPFVPSTDDVYTVFAASFEGTGSFVLKVTEKAREDDGKERLAKRQANAAVALLKLDRSESVWPLFKHSPDPRLRSYLIHRLAALRRGSPTHHPATARRTGSHRSAGADFEV